MAERDGGLLRDAEGRPVLKNVALDAPKAVSDVLMAGTLVDADGKTIVAIEGVGTSSDVEARARKANMPLNLIDEGGCVGNGTTNDTAALVAAEASAFTSGRALYLPPGYNVLTDAFSTRVGILADDPDTSRFTRRDTAGSTFIDVRGSFMRLEGFTADGKRASQPASGGGVIGVARPNGTGAGGALFSGAMTLTAGPAAGATSITVSSASPGGLALQPGEVISLIGGGLSEHARVAYTYTPGATTITLYEPLKNAYTTSAFVAACPTEVVAEGLRVFGGQRDCLFFWNPAYCKALGGAFNDCVDTALDLPCGGIGTVFAGNTMETNGRWCIAVDTGDPTHFPRATGCTFNANHMRLLAGGSDVDGAAIDAFIALQVDGMSITGNTVDISKAGIRGIRLAEDASHCTVTGNAVVGRKVTNVFGISHTTQGTFSQDNHNTISSNNIRHIGTGIEMEQTISQLVSGNTIYNCQDYGINAQINTATAQRIVCVGNDIDTCVAGIRGGGTGGAGSTLKTGLNNIRNASFAAATADAGWTLTSIAGFV